jgi:hypothetical protein
MSNIKILSILGQFKGEAVGVTGGKKIISQSILFLRKNSKKKLKPATFLEHILKKNGLY